MNGDNVEEAGGPEGVEGCEVCADEKPETIAASLERVLRRGGRIRGREAVLDLDERLLADQVIAIYRGVLDHASERKRRLAAPPPVAAQAD